MRYSASALILFVAACGTDSSDNAPAFKVKSSDVTIMPNEEVTKCFYFRTTNTKPVAINRWVSDMTSGSHHMIFYVGGPEHAEGPAGDDCSFSLEKGLNQPSWVFASQTSHSEQQLPTDDGAGKPLAQVIQPNSLGAFQMHYLNRSDKPLVASVDLEAYALPDATEYTETAPYITYNYDISIPPGAVGTKAEANCPAPAGKFWQMSTHAHKQAVLTEVKDGQTMMFQSNEWEHPGRALWDSSPFYTVESGKVSWTCTYNNNNELDPNSKTTVFQGSSAATNEMCMAVGYSFPAVGPTLCLANFVNPITKKHVDCFCPIANGEPQLPGPT